MRQFKSVVMQDTEPTDTNVLWLKDNTLLMYEGGWVPAIKSSKEDTPSIDLSNVLIIPTFKMGDTPEIKAHNLEQVELIKNIDRMPCCIEYGLYDEVKTKSMTVARSTTYKLDGDYRVPYFPFSFSIPDGSVEIKARLLESGALYTDLEE